MKSFKRTVSGLANQHLFHNVDIVVFLEGGEMCYTKAEAYTGRYSDETNDILYWKNIFQKFKDTSKIKFKSIGSKSTIKDIAFDVLNGNITTVMVAMDKEFDDILNQTLSHPNILYTMGYSWENDIWNAHVIREVIHELSAVEIPEEDINKNFSRFLKQIKPAVFVDGYLFSKKNSLFKRPNGYMAVVNCSPTDLPHVKVDAIELLITSKGVKKRTAYAFARRKSISPKMYCFGHLLADYCFQLIMHYLRNRLKLPSLHKEIIYRMGINKFFQNHFVNSEAHLYYQQLLTQNSA